MGLAPSVHLRSRRRSTPDVMKLARTAAAAVSALTVVLDVAAQMNSIKNSHRSD
ncbi:MAG TPA: hypothetical protein VG435_18765 [Acidimicrobiales bacterium]|nr:hypothetical protein [Acidimicrobiales bacterium]